MHEQGGLDERKDFSDAKVVSGMRMAHGKMGTEKRAGRMEDSGADETKSSGFSTGGVKTAKLPPLVPLHSGTIAKRWDWGAHGTQAGEARSEAVTHSKYANYGNLA
jgi:hypothetical protein